MAEYKKYIIVKNVDLPEEQKYQGLSKNDEYEHLNTLEPLGVPMGAVEMTEEEVREVEALPQVAYVQEDKEVSYPNPLEAQDAETQAALAFHNVQEAHSQGFKGKGIRVAVLDTGLDETHATSLGNLLIGTNDFTGGWTGSNDMDGHGTHCMGVVHDVAPEAELMAGKVLGDDGSGSTSGIIKGINWSVTLGADVISMSLGGFPDPDARNDALSLAVNKAREQGVLVPVAAGNDQDSYEGRMCAEESVPAAADRAICVAAVDTNGRIASFSNAGSVVDIAAMGVEVSSWGLNGSTGVRLSGTSMATPHVAGGCAVLLSANPDPTLVETALLKGSRDTSLHILREGNGIMDLARSLALLVGSGEYQPGVDRVSLYKFNDERGELLEKKLVLTIGSGAKKTEIGTFTPKG